MPRVHAATRDKLRGHDWPGNLRELRNVLERALVFHAPQEVMPFHIELDAWIEAQVPLQTINAAANVTLGNGHAKETKGNGAAHNAPMVLPEQGINLEDLERDLLLQALDRARNNQTKAAELLGISRHTFRYRLEKHGIIKH